MKIERQKRAGFSLMEIIVCLVILTFTFFMFASNSTSAKAQAEVTAMQVKAAELNMAMTRYMSLAGPVAAQAEWNSRNNDQRYLLLTPWISHPPAQLSLYVLEGYSLVFPGTLRGGSVKLFDPQGKELAY